MNQSDTSKSKRVALLVVGAGIVVLVVVGALYWNNRVKSARPEQSNSEVAPTTRATEISATNTPVPMVESASTSPVSPVLPLSPISPPPQALPDPAAIEAMIHRGIAQYENKNYQDALKSFNNVLELMPNSFLALNARGSVYVEIEEYENALADFSKAIDVDAFFPHAYYNRGRLYSLSQEYDKAISDFNQSIKISPSQFGYRANGNIGLIYYKQEEYDKALKAFTESISLNTEEKADVYFFRGETHTKLMDYESAIVDYQAAIERFARYGKAYQSLGYAFYKTEQPGQAIEALNKAVELTPDSPQANLYLSLAQLASEQTEIAKTTAAKASESLDSLPDDEQKEIVKKILDDLETFADKNPDQANDVKEIITQLSGQ